ncbi:MAG: cell division protein ZapD [Zetaproteobacteria bacterium]|nr:MAG: cell division protein ZapD [Zetaproteobacteria bacterium]
MNDWVRFTFALNARMQAFVDVRDALYCMDEARRREEDLAWLQAASDLRASLLGDMGRKAALAEIIGLLDALQTSLGHLAEEHPSLAPSIQQACNRLDQHLQALQQPELSQAGQFLVRDALISHYYNAQKKHDLLGHKQCLPQFLPTLRSDWKARVEFLHSLLTPLLEAIETVDQMLNDYVQWQYRTAVEGSDKITPDRKQHYGLLVVGLPRAQVASGLVPDMSGNQRVIRVRFQRWIPAQSPEEVKESVDYAFMLVPIA